MKTIILFLLFLLIKPYSLFSQSSHPIILKPSADNPITPSGCTVFTISKGESVFFGGNDDYINPDSYYWVDKGDSVNYGVIWIGKPDNVQQGVNEKGLAYDANGLPRVDVNPHLERTPVSGDYSIYPIRIMHECSTVDEVIRWINNHQWHSYMHDQMQFADATGNAVIISAGKDGELVFTRKPSGDGFMVSTNFNVSNPSNGYGYPCWRYDTANTLLRQLLDKKEELTIKDVTDVLEAVHVEKGASWTIESLAVDLVNGVVYLYYFYQFDRPVILNVKEELSFPREAGPLSKLFPDDVQQEAGRRYNQAHAKAQLNRIVGMSWATILLVSLVLFFTSSGDYKKGFKFWLPAVIVLGPLALLVRLLTVKINKTACWRAALVETLGDLVPVVVSYTVALVVVILLTISRGTSWQLQLAMMFGLPLITGLLVFHGPFLTSVSQMNFGKFLIQRMPQVLVTIIIGLAGVIPIALPITNKSLAMSQILPLSPWAVMTWWAIVVLGALAGGFLIFLYEHWAVKRGFRAWIILAGSEGEVITPSWRKLWWWILISIVSLLIGLIAGVALLN